jgi:hypothetical protein
MPIVFDTDLPSEVALDEGILYVNSDTPFAVLKAPLGVDLGEEWQNIGFAGKRAPVMGLDRKTYQDAKITGATLIQINETHTPIIFPGSSQTGGTSPVVTLQPMSELLATGDYATNVRAIFKRGDGKFIIYEFAYALIRATGFEGADKDAAGIPVMIEARQNPSDGDTDVAPVTVSILAAI